MKSLKINFLLALMVSVALVSGCKDDSEDNVSGYVGNYVISNAELAEALSVPTTTFGTIPVPAGTNITLMIQTSLLSAVNCTSADKSYVELRKDNSMYMSCEFQNELNAGTWEEVDATTLKLNMNSAAIPTSPTGFVLTVTDIVKNSTGLRGKTSVPIPKTLVAAMLPSGVTLDPAAPAIFTAVFFIDFVKK
jgi:hypothetical protein